MKRLIIILSTLVLLSGPLFAAENNAGSGQQGDASSSEIEEQVRTINEINLDSFVFGRDTYQIAENIQYFSENGVRITKTHFKERDGVLIKLNSENKIFYMKKMPY